MKTPAKLETPDLSRRTLALTTLILAGVGTLVGAGLVATPAAAGSKFSQAMAKYQLTPMGAQRCANCSQFQFPASCKVVDGKIGPDAWCQLYAKKS
jgi:hypothetical protein